MDHRSADTTAKYYTVTHARKRKAIESVKRLSFDTHGAHAPVTEELYSIAAVAVPFGNCTEPTNIKAGGKACPARFQCGGCTFFRSDPSHLPDLKAHLERMKEDLAWQIAQNLRPSLITDTRNEIEAFTSLIHAQESRLADLPTAERDALQEGLRRVATTPRRCPHRSCETLHSGRKSQIQTRQPKGHPVNDPAQKTAAMVRQRKQDSKAKRQAVLATVDAMERTQTPITVAEVGRRAGVSPWLVRQEPLMEAVRRAQARLASEHVQSSRDSTTGSLRVERDLLRQENQRLRHEIDRHRKRTSELLGDQIDGTDAHSQSVRIQELTDHYTALSRQTGEAIQRLHQTQQQLEALSTDLDAAHAVNRALMAQLNRPQQS